MKRKKQYVRYIPSEVVKVIEQLNPKRKDYLYCIIDMINRKQSHFKSKLIKNYRYVEIPMSKFQQLIPNPNYLKSDINFLVENGILEINNHYQVGAFSKSYRIVEELISKTKRVILTNEKLNKRIGDMETKKKSEKVVNLNEAKSKFYNQFKIDYSAAKQEINTNLFNDIYNLSKRFKINITDDEIISLIECEGNWKKIRTNFILNKECRKEFFDLMNKAVIHINMVDMVNDKYLYFKRDTVSGRLHSSLTVLPKYLRKYIKSDEELRNIDIKNSQPFFLYLLVRDMDIIDWGELEFYRGMVADGELYDYLSEEWGVSKKQVKIDIFKIFYSKTTSFKKLKEKFEEYFPTIMEAINIINAEQHNTLAIKLQTLEANMILNIIMPELNKKGIIPYTIHDSFLCVQSESDEIINTINEKFELIYGTGPSLHNESIFGDDSIEIEEFSFDELIN